MQHQPISLLPLLSCLEKSSRDEKGDDEPSVMVFARFGGFFCKNRCDKYKSYLDDSKFMHSQTTEADLDGVGFLYALAIPLFPFLDVIRSDDMTS